MDSRIPVCCTKLSPYLVLAVAGMRLSSGAKTMFHLQRLTAQKATDQALPRCKAVPAKGRRRIAGSCFISWTILAILVSEVRLLVAPNDHNTLAFVSETEVSSPPQQCCLWACMLYQYDFVPAAVETSRARIPASVPCLDLSLTLRYAAQVENNNTILP